MYIEKQQLSPSSNQRSPISCSSILGHRSQQHHILLSTNLVIMQLHKDLTPSDHESYHDEPELDFMRQGHVHTYIKPMKVSYCMHLYQ